MLFGYICETTVLVEFLLLFSHILLGKEGKWDAFELFERRHSGQITHLDFSYEAQVRFQNCSLCLADLEIQLLSASRCEAQLWLFVVATIYWRFS
jgi:hypothetical protein